MNKQDVNQPQLVIRYNNHIICQRYFPARDLDKYTANMSDKLLDVTDVIHQHLCEDANKVKEHFGIRTKVSDVPVILRITTLLDNHELLSENLDISTLPDRVKFKVNVKPVLNKIYDILRK